MSYCFARWPRAAAMAAILTLPPPTICSPISTIPAPSPCVSAVIFPTGSSGWGQDGAVAHLPEAAQLRHQIEPDPRRQDTW
jgi:hypothetical protein